jgi:hypothetical protein
MLLGWVVLQRIVEMLPMLVLGLVVLVLGCSLSFGRGFLVGVL